MFSSLPVSFQPRSESFWLHRAANSSVVSLLCGWHLRPAGKNPGQKCSVYNVGLTRIPERTGTQLLAFLRSSADSILIVVGGMLEHLLSVWCSLSVGMASRGSDVHTIAPRLHYYLRFTVTTWELEICLFRISFLLVKFFYPRINYMSRQFLTRVYRVELQNLGNQRSAALWACLTWDSMWEFNIAATLLWKGRATSQDPTDVQSSIFMLMTPVLGRYA